MLKQRFIGALHFTASWLSTAIPPAWIAFDVLICLRTGYMKGEFPRWEWWAWLLSGLGLAALAWVAGWWDRRHTEQQVAERHEEIKSGQDVIADGLSTALTRLRTLIDAPNDQRPEVTVEAARERLSKLESDLSRIKERQWLGLDSNQKAHLRSSIERHSGRRVQVNSHENPDCQELAHDIKDCFRDAGWYVQHVSLTGGWSSLAVSGLEVNGRTETETLCIDVQHALMDTMRGITVGKLIESRPAPSTPGFPEVFIVVGTKKVRADD